MVLDGMMKLRIAMTILFIVIVISLIISFMAVDTEEKEFNEWYNTLTTEEISQLQDLHSNFPYEGKSSNLYMLSGIFIWSLVIGLFILMIKVWTTKNINSFKEKQTYLEPKKYSTVCWFCNQSFYYKPNVYTDTQVTCPFCKKVGVVKKV